MTTQKKILIVDDEAIVVETIRVLLAQMHYAACGSASSVEEALEMVAISRPDLVLMDVNLGHDQEGIQAARTIRDRFDIPVVFVTAYADESTVERATRSHPFGYVVKPFDKRDLQVAIQVALHGHELEQNLRRSEEALRQSEYRQRAILDNIPDPAWLKDREGRFQAVNRAWCRLHDIEESQVQGKSNFEIFPRNLAAIFHEEDRAVMESGNPMDYEERIPTPDGKVNWYDTSKAPLRTSNGDIVGTIGIARDITARRIMEETLRESEERYRTVVEDQTEVIARLGPDGSYKFANDVFCRVFGKSRKELYGRTWKPDAVAEDLPEIERKLALLSPENPVVVIENRVRIADGQVRWMQFVNRGFYDEAGALKEIQAVARDVTERRTIEDALRESEKKHRALLEALPDVVMRFDREGRHLYASPNVEKVVGLPAEQFLGRTHREMGFPEKWCSFWEERIGRVFQTAEPSEIEYSFTGPLGPKTFDWRLVPEFDEKQVVASVLSVSRDVTQIKAAEQRYQTLFQELQDGLVLSQIERDAEGLPFSLPIISVNPACERLVGRKKDTLLGRSLLELVPELKPSWERALFRSAGTGDPVILEGYSDLLKRHLEVRAFRPAPDQLALFIEDTTAGKQAEEERKRLQAQLLQAQKMEAVGQLAGGVAHDFNNILAAMLMHLELLGEETSVDSETKELLKELESEANRAAALTRQLLLYGRRSTMQIRLVDLNELLVNLMKMLRRLLGEQIEITIRGENDGLMVNADPGMIEQVILNLSLNARDAMPNGGRLSLSLTRTSIQTVAPAMNLDAYPGEFACLMVQDTGTGMDEATRERIFDPFFTTKGVGKGTGLGLATVYGIVRQHEGWLQVESTPEVGSTFRVFLPLAKRIAAEESAATSPKAMPGGGETVLLVEDEAGVRRVASLFLRRRGYEVLEAGDAHQALALWEQHGRRIAVLFTDMVMPGGMSGLELATRLREKKPDLPVIICSGYSTELLESEGRFEPALVYVPKPYEPMKLAEIMREVLDNRQPTS